MHINIPQFIHAMSQALYRRKGSVAKRSAKMISNRMLCPPSRQTLTKCPSQLTYLATTHISD